MVDSLSLALALLFASSIYCHCFRLSLAWACFFFIVGNYVVSLITEFDDGWVDVSFGLSDGWIERATSNEKVRVMSRV